MEEPTGGSGVDVTSVIDTVTSTGGDVALVGGAVLAVLVGIKAIKWIARAM